MNQPICLLQKNFIEADCPCQLEFRNPQPPFPMHSHEFHEIAVIYQGEGTHISGGEEFRLMPGDIISIKPGQEHSYTDVNRLVLMNVLVRPSFLADRVGGIFGATGYADLFLHQPHAAEAERIRARHFRMTRMELFETRAILESIGQEMSNMQMLWREELVIHLKHLIVMLLRAYNGIKQNSAADGNNAAALIKYVEMHYTKNITMKDLMEVSNMSESTVIRTFKRITGRTPSEFQMWQRVVSAMNELANTQKDITHIAFDMGFNDSNYFSRCFKKFVNLTPRDYRKQFGKAQSPVALSPCGT